jgi:fucose 4-O-acetylase-like acetyltransferase
MKRLAAWAWITVIWLTYLCILVAAFGAPPPPSLKQHLAAGALGLMVLLLSCVVVGSAIISDLAKRTLLILAVPGFIVMVVLGVTAREYKSSCPRTSHFRAHIR